MKIIVVAGPVGCGKSKWARYLATMFQGEVICTDDFIKPGIKWEDVPGAVMEDIKNVQIDFPEDPYIILEGTRALSVIYHNNLKDQVAEVWWGEHDPKRDKCEGLLTRQQDLLKRLELTPRFFPAITLPRRG